MPTMMYHVRIDFDYPDCLEVDPVVDRFLESHKDAHVFSGNSACGPYAECYVEDVKTANELEQLWEDYRDQLALISRLEKCNIHHNDTIRLANWFLGNELDDGVDEYEEET